MVHAKLLPLSTVSKWPVAAGTARGLRRLYKSKTTNTATLRSMLIDLYCRLRSDGVLATSDWLGTVGAALCWKARMQKKQGKRGSRYDYTTQTSELDLEGLHKLGIQVPS